MAGSLLFQVCQIVERYTRRIGPWILDSVDDSGMIVPGVVHGVVPAIAGQKVEDDVTVFRKQLSAVTTFIPDIHVEQVQQAYPLRIDYSEYAAPTLNAAAMANGPRHLYG